LHYINKEYLKYCTWKAVPTKILIYTGADVLFSEENDRTSLVNLIKAYYE